MSNTSSQTTQSNTSQPRVILFVAAIIVGVVSESMIIFATPLMVLDITGTPSSAGLAFAVEWLPAVLIYPFAGVIVDRLGGRNIFIAASVARSTVIVISLLLYFLFPQYAVAILMFNAGFMSLLMAPNRMSVEKIVPQIAQGRQLASVQSAVQNSELIALTAGPALAAFLVVYTDKAWILLVAGVLFVLSALPIFLLHLNDDTKEKSADDSSANSIRKDMVDGVKLLMDSKPLVRLALLNCFINLLFAVSLASHAAVIKTQFELTDSAYGILNSVSGGLGLLNLILIPFILKKLDVYHLGIIGLGMILMGMFATSLAPSYWPYLMGFVFASVGVTFFNVFNRTQRIKAINKNHIGKVMGPFYVVNLMTMPIGGVFVAVFANSYGNQSIILFTTLALLVIGPPLLVASQRSFLKTFEKLGLSN